MSQIIYLTGAANRFNEALKEFNEAFQRNRRKYPGRLTPAQEIGIELLASANELNHEMNNVLPVMVRKSAAYDKLTDELRECQECLNEVRGFYTPWGTLSLKKMIGDGYEELSLRI